jgi:hypothetical protein
MSIIKQTSKTAFLYLILVFIITQAKVNAGLPSPASSLIMEKGQKIYVFHAPIRNLNEFRELVLQAARLKPIGRVEVNISTRADKGFYEIPKCR